MRKEDKGVIIGQLADTVKEYGHFYLVDTTAMDAAATSELRRKCFKAGISSLYSFNNFAGALATSLNRTEVVPFKESNNGEKSTPSMLIRA